MLFGSCSPNVRAKRLIRQAYAKIDQASKLDPSVIDSIKSVKNIPVFVPGDTGSVTLNIKIDSGSFFTSIKRHDSLSRVSDSLARELKTMTLDGKVYEKYMEDLEKTKALQAKANLDLKRNNDRLIKGFSKDSVYHFEDSLVIFDAEIKSGIFYKLRHKVKDRTVTTKVPTTNINLNNSPPIWRNSWFWAMVCLNLMELLAIIVLLRKN